MSLVPLEFSLFDTVGGLPVHPLVVHFAVVLLPLSALLLIALVFVPRWRARWATPALLGVAAGTAASIVAKESGEALAARIGEPDTHARLGGALPIVAVALLLVGAAWYVLQRRDARVSRGRRPASTATLLTGLLSAALALAATVLTVLVGHTGASAAWSGRLADASVTAPPAASASATTPASATSTATAAPATATANAAGLTTAMVAAHNKSTDCWSIVNGQVYDLTAWIPAHPGGRQRIIAMCGRDATAEFTAQHGSQASVQARLATFKKGALAG